MGFAYFFSALRQSLYQVYYFRVRQFLFSIGVSSFIFVSVASFMADDSLLALWERMSLNPEERTRVEVASAMLRQPISHHDTCLVGWLLIPKLFNMAQFRGSLRNIWRIHAEL